MAPLLDLTTVNMSEWGKTITRLNNSLCTLPTTSELSLLAEGQGTLNGVITIYNPEVPVHPFCIPVYDIHTVHSLKSKCANTSGFILVLSFCICIKTETSYLLLLNANKSVNNITKSHRFPMAIFIWMVFIIHVYNSGCSWNHASNHKGEMGS